MILGNSNFCRGRARHLASWTVCRGRHDLGARPRCQADPISVTSTAHTALAPRSPEDGELNWEAVIA
jgi:hypothetical protein